MKHLRALKHGACRDGIRSKAYSVWLSMRARCRNLNDPWYGGKGIKICQRWETFDSFLSDMGNPPTNKHQLDRIDGNKDYSVENCRWVTPQENSLNRKSIRWITYQDQTKSLAQWARDLNLNLRTLKTRIDAGWELERALVPSLEKQQGGRFN